MGKYTTDEDHLCPHHRVYNKRSPGYYKQKALKISPTIHRLFELIFDQHDKYPKQLYKTCGGLLNLARVYKNSDNFDKVCTISIEQHLSNYGFIKLILDNKITDAISSSTVDRPLPKHNNIRARTTSKLPCFNMATASSSINLFFISLFIDHLNIQQIMQTIESQFSELRLNGMKKSCQAIVEMRRQHELNVAEGIEILINTELIERGNRHAPAD